MVNTETETTTNHPMISKAQMEHTLQMFQQLNRTNMPLNHRHQS